MSSTTPNYPNEGLNPNYLSDSRALTNSDVRLAYYIYTWDEYGKQRQKTGWSSIGSYTLDASGENIIYQANVNQLIKTAGSAGVSVVAPTLGVIANVQGSTTTSDVMPIILHVDYSYIAGLDNISTLVDSSVAHTTLDELDIHYPLSSSLNDLSISYTNLFGNSVSYSVSNNDDVEIFAPFTSYVAGTVQENTLIPVVGVNTHGINEITNKGFVYNAYNYERRADVIQYYMNLYNYVRDWSYQSNSIGVTSYGDKTAMEFASASNDLNIITQITDRDILQFGTFKQIFQSISANSSIYSETAGILEEIENALNIQLGNTTSSPLATAPVTLDIISSTISALEKWNSIKNNSDYTDVWEDATTAIIIDKIPFNEEFINLAESSTATGIAGINWKTKQWTNIAFPNVDETYVRILQNSISNYDGSSSLTINPNWINMYPIIYYHSDSTYITSSNEIDVYAGTATGIVPLDMNDAASSNIIIWNSATSQFVSNSYFLQENNINNSASNYRFIGLKTSNPDPYANDQGSNVVELTGFNKILISDLYENPNQYQVATTTYYYYDPANTANVSSSSNVEDITGTLSSYSVSLSSASAVNTNFMIAGVGRSDSATIGYDGAFYIPLPSEIDQDDNNAYQDTHWMLTTWTPNISNNAIDEGILNHGNVLYKYTKMNDLITTGMYGGFTPYYNPNGNIVAGLVNIPQISWGSNDGSINGVTYVQAAVNQAAKLTNMMYRPNGGSAIGNLAVTDSSDATAISTFTNYIAITNSSVCVITLNSNERNIIENQNWMDNNGSNISNVAYLDLIGYADEEFDNLSFDVNRKYIFTFNCHVQATSLHLLSNQIEYGVPSLMLIGHFRNRYCKSSLPVNGSTVVYTGKDVFIPLLNKPLENPVNNIYNINGTYTLSWNTTGTSTEEFPHTNTFEMYIPDNAKSIKITSDTTFATIYDGVFGSNDTDIPTTNITAGNILHFENVLDRIYAVIMTGENVNPNVSFQFVNNTTYQNDTTRILANDDIKLFAGYSNVDFTDNNFINTNVMQETGIDSGILGVNEPMISMIIQQY